MSAVCSTVHPNQSLPDVCSRAFSVRSKLVSTASVFRPYNKFVTGKGLGRFSVIASLSAAPRTPSGVGITSVPGPSLGNSMLRQPPYRYAANRGIATASPASAITSHGQPASQPDARSLHEKGAKELRSPAIVKGHTNVLSAHRELRNHRQHVHGCAGRHKRLDRLVLLSPLRFAKHLWGNLG